MIIKHLELLTNNIFQTEAFYSHLLQFPINSRSDSHLTFTIGHSTLTFRLTRESTPFYHLAFLIPENKLEEALQFISSKSSVIPFSASNTIASFENWNAQAFYFYDNHQNILEFIVRYDLKLLDETRFSSSSIVGINEIGIAVANVPQEANHLIADFGLSFYERGPTLSDFTALGDANGLILLVDIGRGWFPTGKPAEQHWTKLKLEVNGHLKELTFG